MRNKGGAQSTSSIADCYKGHIMTSSCSYVSLVLVLFSLSLELSHVNVALGVHACGDHLHSCHDS